MKHYTVTITSCPKDILGDQLTLGLFIKKLLGVMGEKPLESCVFVPRVKIGHVVFCAWGSGTLTVETFISTKQAVFTFTSSFASSFDRAQLRNCFFAQLFLKPDQFEDHYCEGKSELIECEEPHCSTRAAKTWGGRQVCSDHFDQYRENHLKFLRENQDS